MKKIIYQSIILASILLPHFVFSQTQSNKESTFVSIIKSKEGSPIWTTTDLFNRRLFIENKGQFDGNNNIPEDNIKYGIFENGVWIYFSKNGLIYRTEVAPKLSERDMEELEHTQGEKHNKILSKLKPVTTIVNIEWLGANPDVKIEAIDESKDYFTYPDPKKDIQTGTITTKGYKKIIYRNVYPFIDIEYVMMPEENRGLKYTVILHPGADASLLKMKYSGIKKLKMDKEGNVIIHSKMLDIKDHTPLTNYQEGIFINSRFIINNDTIVTFQLDNYDHSKTVIIDPAVTWSTATTYASTNKAYDIDYDNGGNVYVYGGASPFYLIKLNNAGAIQWTYNSTDFSGGIAGGYGDLAVDPVSGRTYLCEGLNLGNSAKIVKVSDAGTKLGVTTDNHDIDELWRMAYNPCISKAVIGGGDNSAANEAAMLDTNLTSVTPVNIFGASGPTVDVALLAMDDYGNTYMASSNPIAGSSTLGNFIVKSPIPTLLPAIPLVSDGYGIGEYRDFLCERVCWRL